MNLHEYQAKQLFARYGLPTPEGYVCHTVAEALAAAAQLGAAPWVVKCQVHAGGRGKAGGVSVVNSTEELQCFAEKWLGNRLVTYQTDTKGQPVNQLLVEAVTTIAQELYLGAVIDRSSQRVIFMASTAGGMDIETVAQESPEKIYKVALDPLTGPQPFQGRELAVNLGFQGKQITEFSQLFMRLAKLFLECDLALVEVNPLVVTSQGTLMCLDGKINIDGNALYRQPELKAMQDLSQEDAREAQATRNDLNYIALEGNIGCMVNGAGLAMGTMDIVKLHGGRPANFLDVGGGATRERVSEAFKLILSDEAVEAVFVNIFGGIVRCDLIAEGIIGAVAEVGVNVPVVVRLEGNNAESGARKLAESGLNIIAENGLNEAARRVVAVAGGR